MSLLLLIKNNNAWARQTIERFVSGGVIGAWFDSMHVKHNVLTYESIPERGKMSTIHVVQPPWVRWLFGFATIFLGRLSRLMRADVDMSNLSVVTCMAWYFLAYQVTCHCRSPTFILGVLFLTRASMMSLRLLYFGMACATIGCCTEFLLVRMKMFRYLETSTIPYWLPLVYLHVAPFIACFERLPSRRPFLILMLCICIRTLNWLNSCFSWEVSTPK